MGCSKSISKREVYSNTTLPQETTTQVNNLTLHLKQLEKEEQKTPKVSRRKKNIKIRGEKNEVEIKKKKKPKPTTITKINETKSWFFEKINKIHETLARLIKKKRKGTEINKIRSEKEVTTDTKEMQRIIRDYYK